MSTRTITECEVCKREIKRDGFRVFTDKHRTHSDVHSGECLNRAIDVLRGQDVEEVRLWRFEVTA